MFSPRTAKLVRLAQVFLYVKASLMNYLLSGLCPHYATPLLFCSGRTPAQALKTDPEGQPEHQVTSLSTSHSGKQKRLAVSIFIQLREENCIPDKQSVRAGATCQQDRCLRQSSSIVNVNKSSAHSSKRRSWKTGQQPAANAALFFWRNGQSFTGCWAQIRQDGINARAQDSAY